MSYVNRFIAERRVVTEAGAVFPEPGRILSSRSASGVAGAEQVTLTLVALLGHQELRLGLGLDALGDDAQTEGAGPARSRARHTARAS